MKLSSHSKILVITAASLVLFVLVMILLISTREGKSEYQTIVNEYEGYQIVVPLEWDVEEPTREGRGLGIFFGGEEYYESGLDVAVGLTLAIVTFDNPEELSITDWLKQSPDAFRYQDSEFMRAQLGQYTSLKATVEIIDEELHRLGGVTAEIPLWVTYLLENEDSIYAVSCIAYSDIDVLIPLCEKQVQTFTILNEDPLSEFFPYGGDGFEIDFNDADFKAGDSTYRVVLKPTLGLGADGFEKEIDAIVERANNWITSKGIDPKSLSIEWVTE